MESTMGSFKYNDLEVYYNINKKPLPEWDKSIGIGKHETDHMLICDWSEKHGWERPKIVPF